MAGGIEEKGREEEKVVVAQGGRDVEDQSWKGLEMDWRRAPELATRFRPGAVPPRGRPVAHVMWDGDARWMYGDESAEGVAWVASRLMVGFQRGGWALRVEMRRRMAWGTSRRAVTTTSAS